jgi:transcriptional regulator with XRE-family HTH domain
MVDSHESTPGQILRNARQRAGVSQARLAIRAGTTQSAISRIERDQVSPSVATLRGLLHLLGIDLKLEAVDRDAGIDRAMVRSRLALAPEDRVKAGLELAELVRRNRGSARSAA